VVFSADIDIPFLLRGIEIMMSSHTRMLFRAERREAVWRLSGFDAVYLRDEIVPVIAGPGNLRLGRAHGPLLNDRTSRGAMSKLGQGLKSS
jgi:hypothetical protein